MIQKYRAAPTDDLIWHALDSMTLLFHRPSGITHMLADPAPAILEIMADATLSADEIASRLAAEFDIDSGGDTENIVHARLAELSGLGLVERIPV
jgi:PqqD family protein of HPr-rel-A system|tara:strand:- start:14097 stop:14381 length:285 start_codon:yes stop_codon:yes gene_type:complete